MDYPNSKPVTDLKNAPYNARKISDKRLSDLQESMLLYGDLSGIVKNIETGNILAGNQRTKNIKALENAQIIFVHDNSEGPDEVGTLREGYIILQENGARFNYREVLWDEATELAANLAANNLHGRNVESGVASLLDQINTKNATLLKNTGFHEKQIERMIKTVHAEDPEKPAAEPGLEAVSFPGEVYEIGVHRLICGNAEQKFCDRVRQLYAESKGHGDDWIDFTPKVIMHNPNAQAVNVPPAV